jgi:hypothetical protein
MIADPSSEYAERQAEWIRANQSLMKIQVPRFVIYDDQKACSFLACLLTMTVL